MAGPTKTTSVRLPIEEYVRFRKEAAEMKMNMNDFILLKLYDKGSAKSPSGSTPAPSDDSRLTQALEGLLSAVDMLVFMRKREDAFEYLEFDYYKHGGIDGLLDEVESGVEGVGGQVADMIRSRVKVLKASSWNIDDL